jgi:hypothetical protein
LKLDNGKFIQLRGNLPFNWKILLHVGFIPSFVLFDLFILNSLCLEVFIGDNITNKGFILLQGTFIMTEHNWSGSICHLMKDKVGD